MSEALISLGSNLGDRAAELDRAVELLRASTGIQNVAVSSYLATQPIGGPENQKVFLNAAARIETNFSARQLFHRLQEIEQTLGRVRDTHWGPRGIDLDLLLFDQATIQDDDLIVPHRFLAFRRFVLQPASEIAADMVHPVLNRRVAECHSYLDQAAEIFEFGGTEEKFRESLARDVATSCGLSCSHEFTETDILWHSEVRLLKCLPKARIWIDKDVHSDYSCEFVPTLVVSSHSLALATQEATHAIKAMRPFPTY